MSNRDPHDPDGEYEGMTVKNHNLGHREDCFCAQEGYAVHHNPTHYGTSPGPVLDSEVGTAYDGWTQVETQDEPIDADITTLGDDTCAGEFARETMEDTLRTTIADLTEAINVAGRHTQYLVEMRKDLTEHLNALTDYRGAPRNVI